MRASGLKKSIGERVLFENLTFNAPTGTLTVIRGHSGSGKSTLLRCLAHLESLTSGSLCLFNCNLDSMAGSEWRKRVLYVPQKCPKLPGTPLDTIKEGARMRKVQFVELFEQVVQVCSELGIPNRLLYEQWSTLSGGEQQRIIEALGMSFRPSVVLLDEPTASLDPVSMLQLERFMLARRKELIIFWITHDEEQGKRLKPDQVLDFNAN